MAEKFITLNALRRFMTWIDVALIKLQNNYRGVIDSKLDDAPSDDKQYARKNGAWSEVESGGSMEWLTDAEINAMFD